MTQGAFDRSYVNTSCPKPEYVAKPELHEPVTADGRDLLFVPFRGPRMGIQVAITVGETVYRLKGVFAVRLDYLDDGTVVAEHLGLPVSGHGRTVGEALSEFGLAFDALWLSLNESGAQLTRHAERVRLKMRAMVESVTVQRRRNDAP